MNRIRILLVFFIFNIACVEEIELDASIRAGRIIIFGSINTSDLPQQIVIYRTSALPNRFNPMIGATVKIIDQDGNEGRAFGDNEGRYTFNPNSLSITPGNTYYLDIQLISGEHYQSTPQTIPVVSAVSQVSRNHKEVEQLSNNQVVTTKRVMEITATTDIINPSNETFYLRWSIEEVYRLSPTDFPDPFNDIPPPCYITREVDAQRTKLFNGANFIGSTLSEKVLAQREIDYTFLEKHFFTTSVHAITKEAYDFWRQVDLLTNSTGSIFDVPPAKIKGNLFNVNDNSDIVLGFFEVANTTYSRFKTYIDEGPFPKPASGCQYFRNKPFEEYPDYCLSCDNSLGGSTVRPTFFDD